MPWRMIGFVVLLVLVAAFATLNLSNRTDISLGLYVFREVPIFLSLLVAFLAGILVMIPFTVGRGRRRKRIRPLSVERAGGEGGAGQEAEIEPPQVPSPAPKTVAPRSSGGRGKVRSTGNRKPAAR